jgi:NAD(P)-dependent dehydrogenase (short-subunit alcohol dehydrogenase family)
VGLLDDKTTVITGASTGIGLATAQRFIDEGAARVFITGSTVTADGGVNQV